MATTTWMSGFFPTKENFLRLGWVGAYPCYFPYIEWIPTSEFGITTDVRQATGYDIWLAAVLPQSANSCPSWVTSKRQAHAVFQTLDPLQTIVERQHLPEIRVSAIRPLFFSVSGGANLCLPVTLYPVTLYPQDMNQGSNDDRKTEL